MRSINPPPRINGNKSHGAPGVNNRHDNYDNRNDNYDFDAAVRDEMNRLEKNLQSMVSGGEDDVSHRRNEDYSNKPQRPRNISSEKYNNQYDNRSDNRNTEMPPPSLALLQDLYGSDGKEIHNFYGQQQQQRNHDQQSHQQDQHQQQSEYPGMMLGRNAASEKEMKRAKQAEYKKQLDAGGNNNQRIRNRSQSPDRIRNRSQSPEQRRQLPQQQQQGGLIGGLNAQSTGEMNAIRKYQQQAYANQLLKDQLIQNVAKDKEREKENERKLRNNSLERNNDLQQQPSAYHPSFLPEQNHQGGDRNRSDRETDRHSQPARSSISHPSSNSYGQGRNGQGNNDSSYDNSSNSNNESFYEVLPQNRQQQQQQQQQQPYYDGDRRKSDVYPQQHQQQPIYQQNQQQYQQQHQQQPQHHQQYQQQQQQYQQNQDHRPLQIDVHRDDRYSHNDGYSQKGEDSEMRSPTQARYD
jgi:hypothetical protein